jgi:hypothetical protein
MLSAQTNKGKFFIGADFSESQNLEFAITQSKSDSDSGGDPVKTKSFSFDMMPKVGYFVIDNLALGLDFTLSSGFSKNTNDEFKYSSILLAAGPLIRYYIPTKKVIPFAEAYYSIGFYNGKSEYFYGESSFKYAVQYYGLGLGISVPLGEKVSFDASAGYNNSVTKEKEDNENNDRLVRGNYGFKLGFSIFLGSGKGNT